MRTSYQTRTRLYVSQPSLAADMTVSIDGHQAHYLRGVLRAQVGEVIEIFNGADGAFAAELSGLTKSAAQLKVLAQTAHQETLPKVALAFALLKKERTQMVVEKATELGAARIMPMVTARTQGRAVKQWKTGKAMAHAIEACEQCGRTALPEIADVTPLADVLKQPGQLLYADEMRAGEAAPWPRRDKAQWTTLLIGPEGGWSEEEREMLCKTERSGAVTLGPRILRAETAAIVGLGLQLIGDD